MAELVNNQEQQKRERPKVTIEDVNRVLEVGRILLSVLTPEELEQLKEEMRNRRTQCDIGNTSGT